MIKLQHLDYVTVADLFWQKKKKRKENKIMKKRRRKKSRQGKRYSQINFVSTSQKNRPRPPSSRSGSATVL